MLYKLNFSLLVLLLTTLSGCSALNNKSTAEIKENTNRGNMPIHYEKTIDEYLANTLKYPFSVKLKNMSSPEEVVHKEVKVLNSPTLINVNRSMRETRYYGWLVSVDVYAKNSYGAYTGWKKYDFIFRNEEIILVND